MFCPTKKFFKKGLSLIEVVIALFVLGIIGGALVAISLQITSATNSAKLKGHAVALAQEAIEQARDVKSQGWTNFPSTKTCYVDGKISATVVCSDTDGWPVDSTFGRMVIVTPNAAGDQVQIQSKVFWKEKGKTQTVEVDTYFYQF